MSAELDTIPWGRGVVVREGHGVALLVFGTLLETALQVAETLDATVVNMRFVKPLDEALIDEVADSHHLLATLEENVVAGGAGSGVAEYLASKGCAVPLIPFGFPDRFIEQATQAEQLEDAGLTADQIEKRVRAALESLPELPSTTRMVQAKP